MKKSKDILDQKKLEQCAQMEAISGIIRCETCGVFDEQRAYRQIKEICWNITKSMSYEIENNSFIDIQIESDKINE